MLSELFLADTGTKATQILDEGLLAQDAVKIAIFKLWDDVLRGGGGLYVDLTQVGVLFALGTLLLFMVQWAKNMMEDEGNRPFSDLIWPLIVIILLSNNGKALANGTIELRNIINETNRRVLETTSASVKLQDAYRQIVGEAGAEAAMKGVMSRCSAIVDPKQQADCLNNAATQVEQIASSLKTPPSGGLAKFISSLKANPLEMAQQAIGSYLGLLLRTWLLAMGIAFQWLVEISLLLTG
ncbi:MAG: hypothetical protein F6K23_39750, partial [Okeania sp. SIO2C9]|uniref:hypothetical protein n=1 Tax=Okeania sp. SIO2C9 TaxID=2607791 RepID=UPI0013C04AC6